MLRRKQSAVAANEPAQPLRKKPSTTAANETAPNARKKKSSNTDVGKKEPSKSDGKKKKKTSYPKPEGEGVVKKFKGLFKPKGKSKNGKNTKDTVTEGDAPSKAVLGDKPMPKPKSTNKRNNKDNTTVETDAPSKMVAGMKERQEPSKAVSRDPKLEDDPKVEKRRDGSRQEMPKEVPKEMPKEAAEEEKKEPMTLIDLNEGDVLMGEKNIAWKIVRELGRGGFGKVHEVFNDGVRGGAHLACKTEARNEDVKKRNRLRLKIEVTVLLAIYNAKLEKTRHFVELIDKGRDKERGLKFVVMTMLGPSLHELRKKIYANKSYPQPTGLYVAQQTFEAIQDFHEIGFIHRDIKPQNFAIGKGSNETAIYLYDFGISRRLYDDNGATLRKARVDGKVRFCGTPRYASIRCHEGREQARKDDLESWIYMMYDLFDNEKGLRWKTYKLDELGKYLEMKKKFMGQTEITAEEKAWYCGGAVPAGFDDIKGLLKDLGYESRPPYEKIQEMINKAAATSGVMPSKLEWVGKNFEPSKEKQEYSRGAQQQGGSVTL